MIQIFNISIDGVDVTHRYAGGSVSEETNRIYDIASITLDDSAVVLLDKNVVINYGDKTFTGFVYNVSKTGRNQITVECRTYTAKFTEPFSTHEEVVDPATTSHALCAYYTAETGIPITITAEDLDFGGSYERSGTILSALTNIASVTGAEYYNENGTLIIAPNKAIDGEGLIIPDEHIFDFIGDSKSIYNKGVGFITIQSGGDVSTDIISKNSIYAEIDECSGEIFVFPNPNGLIEQSNGISPLNYVLLERKEEYPILDYDLIELNGAIESITSMTLNGVAITDYNFEAGHNVVYFNTIIRGTLNVVYNAHCYKGFTNINVTPLGRFISLDIYYLDQALRFQGFLSPDCTNSQTDGDMTCITPSEMMYNAGFNVYTIGGDPEFTFYDRNVLVAKTVISTAIDYISVESVTLEETLTGFRFKTRYPIKNDLGARSANIDVAYTTSIDGDDYYFEFTEYFPEMLVSYETDAIQHFIQFPTISNGTFSMVIRNKNTDQVCEYEISAKIPCQLNQDIWINVAGQLGLEVTDIAGKVVPLLDPNAVSSNLTIDVFGYVFVPVTVNGDYLINTETIKDKTTITLTAQV